MKSDFFYVGVENPELLRRNLLEASKGMIQVLQRYEKLKAIRAEKYANAAKLKAVYDNIVNMMSEMKAELPSPDIRSLPKHDKHEEIRMARKSAGEKEEAPVKQEKPIKKPMTGIERLEAELNEIEQKLKAIE